MAETRQDQDAEQGARGERGPSRRAALRDAERRCLVHGESRARGYLIRFVLGPDHAVVPDVAERLPGRGMWVAAERGALETAVRKNLFAKAAKTHAKADPHLPDQVEALLAKRCLEFLGLARGAGLVVAGQMQVEQALKARELACVLVAADAGADGTKKLLACGATMQAAEDIRSVSEEGRKSLRPVLQPSVFGSAQLGAALGRDMAVYIGLRPHSLTEQLVTTLHKLVGVRAAESCSHLIQTEM